jgi:predicted signal transduction protein with EAL and GGDEF domain
MSEQELIAKGNALLTWLVNAEARVRRMAELADKLVQNPLSEEQVVELDRLVEVVAGDFLQAREELIKYQSLLAARRSLN